MFKKNDVSRQKNIKKGNHKFHTSNSEKAGRNQSISTKHDTMTSQRFTEE